MTLPYPAQPTVLALVPVGMSCASPILMNRTNSKAASLLGISRNDAMLTGWLLPNGTFAPNAYGEHLTAAAALGCTNPEAAGWVHVSAGIALAGDRRPTRRQIDALLDLVGEGRIELPGFMAAQAA